MSIKATKWTHSNGNQYYKVRYQNKILGIKVEKLFKTLREAKTYINDLKNKIRANEPIPEKLQNNVTFNQAVNWIIKNPKSLNVNGEKSDYQLNRYLAGYRILLDHHWGGIPVKTFTTDDVINRLYEIEEEKDWSSKTKYDYQTFLDAFFKICLQQKWCLVNPVDNINRTRHINKRQRLITQDEFDALLEAAHQIADEKQHLPTKGWVWQFTPLFLEILWETGARRKEIAMLTWDCVDFDDNPKSSIGANILLRKTKNYEDRNIYVSKVTALKLYAQKALFPGDRVFPPAPRAKEWANSFTGKFSMIKKKAGLDKPDSVYNEEIVLHHFRHAWATYIFEKGASVDEVKSFGGWKNTTMLDRYMKPQQKRAKSLANKMFGGDNVIHLPSTRT